MIIRQVIKIFCILALTLNISFAQESDDIAKTKEEVLEIKNNDITFGDKNAPVTIIEYASLSCSHCADFHSNEFPELKENYIDTGKVLFVFRDFPLDEPALRGSMLAHCSGDKADKFLKIMFKTQNNWAPKKNYLEILSNIAKLGGMTGEEFESCIQNKELERMVIKNKLDGAKVMEVRSTPTLFINGNKHLGDRSYNVLSKIIDDKLAIDKNTSQLNEQ